MPDDPLTYRYKKTAKYNEESPVTHIILDYEIHTSVTQLMSYMDKYTIHDPVNALYANLARLTQINHKS